MKPTLGLEFFFLLLFLSFLSACNFKADLDEQRVLENGKTTELHESLDIDLEKE